MKKLLMAVGLFTAIAIGTQGAFAWSWGCDTCKKAEKPSCGCTMKKPDCGCKKKDPCPCETKDPCAPEKCEQCANAGAGCGDCFTKKSEELYCRLGLTDCQKEEARKIKDKYECENQAIRDKMKADHECLCDAINASCLDKKAVNERAKTLKCDVKDLKKQLKCMDKEFKTILECKQKGDYRKIKREMKYRCKKAMKYCCKVCTD